MIHAPQLARRDRTYARTRRLLIDGVTQMASTFLDPDGALPFDRETQLATTLGALLTLALGGDQSSRKSSRDQLAAHPIVEGVCQIFNIWEAQP